MNIFELYLDKIKSTIVDLQKKDELIIPDTLNGISAEIPPAKFDCDISTNVAMVLSKINKKSPLDLAEKISLSLKNNDSLIQNIDVVKPGFINIKFKPVFWSNFIEDIIANSKTFGINKKEKKLNYLVEFVSANSKGDFLFILESIIATLVEISQSNFIGGISALILSKLLGKIILS